jgi:hypothetical protein
MCGREANFYLSLHCFSRQDVGNKVILLKNILGRALESQRIKGDCREAMKTIFNE